MAAGLPRWVPLSADSPNGPRHAQDGLYLWATTDGPRSLLVVRHSDEVVSEVRAHCVEVLTRGRERLGGGAVDLDLEVALVRIDADGLGYGPLGRDELLPTRDLLVFAIHELSTHTT